MQAIVFGGVLLRRVEQHHDVEEQHHDGAGVDDDLNDGNERRVEEDVESRDGAEREHQQQHAVHRVALPDDERRGEHRERAEDVEQHRLRH
jgi:hypothetical protein